MLQVICPLWSGQTHIRQGKQTHKYEHAYRLQLPYTGYSEKRPHPGTDSREGFLEELAL
jgi:hypothetical protein